MAGISVDGLKALADIKSDLRKDRDKYRSTFSDIGNYINPDMGDWDEISDPARSGGSPDTGTNRYDPTAEAASALATDGINSYAMGRDKPWFRIEPEGDEHKKGDDALQYLQLAEKQMYKQLNRSSFYNAASLFIRSFLDFGTAIMFRQIFPEKAMVVYRAQHLGRCFIKENMYGDIDVLFREFWYSPQDAVKAFGLDTLPAQIKEAYSQNSTERTLYTHYCFPSDRFDIDMQGGKLFSSIYVSAADTNTDLQVGGYEAKPFFVSRYARSYDGGAWGSSCPGIRQLSNIKQLTSLVRDRRKISQRMAGGMWKATEGLYGMLNLTPEGITHLPPGEDFTQVAFNAKIEAEDMDILNIRTAINDAYQTKFYFILSQNIDRIKTATEATGIQGEQAAMLTASLSRLGYEFQEPVLEDLFMVEFEAGRLPPPPRSLAGKEMKIDFISPLYQMQKRHLLLNSSSQAFREIAALAEMQLKLQGAPVLDNFDFDEQARNIANTYNMNKTIVKALVDVEKIRKGRAEQQAAMMQFKMQGEAQQVKNETTKANAAAAKAQG